MGQKGHINKLPKVGGKGQGEGAEVRCGVVCSVQVKKNNNIITIKKAEMRTASLLVVDAKHVFSIW